jgi:hypothetical protein
MGFDATAEISYCAMYLSSMSAAKGGTRGRALIAKISQYSSTNSPCTFPGNISYESVAITAGVGTDTGYNNGTEETAIVLETETTYSNETTNNGLGWDFGTVWEWDGANSRPRLQWQTQ